MSIHTELRDDVLGPLVAGRYYQNKFPQERTTPTWPAIRGVIVNRDNQADQCGAGTDQEDDIRLQLDICAATYEELDTLRALVWAAMDASDQGWIRQPGHFETWDAEAKVHRASCDFMLYQSSPA